MRLSRRQQLMRARSRAKTRSTRSGCAGSSAARPSLTRSGLRDASGCRGRRCRSTSQRHCRARRRSSTSSRSWLPRRSAPPLVTSHLRPMIEAALGELEQAGATEKPTVAVADAQYWNEQHMYDVTAEHGIQVLIPPDSGKRKGERPGWTGGRYSFMRRVLATDLGKQLYRKRQQSIEPVDGHTKHNRGFDRFQLSRKAGGPCRVAINHDEPQPHQAPPAPDRPPRGLKRPPPGSHRPIRQAHHQRRTHQRPPQARLHDFAQQPPRNPSQSKALATGLSAR